MMKKEKRFTITALGLRGGLRLMAFVLIAALTAALLLAGCSDDAASSKPDSATADEATGANEQGTVDEEWLHGTDVDRALIVGTWVSYLGDRRVEYAFDDDGCSFVTYEGYESAEYQYEIQGDRFIRSRGENRQVYIWSERAVTFIADHEYGEAANLKALIGDRIENFAGYMYVQGDYMYLGKLVLCRKEKTEGFDSESIVGSWTGVEGDRVTFTADGAYHYRQEGHDYNGTFSVDEATGDLNLVLDGNPGITLKPGEWDIFGRVLRLREICYFRDSEE